MIDPLELQRLERAHERAAHVRTMRWFVLWVICEAITLYLSYAALMLHAFGQCLGFFFGGGLFCGWIWSRIFAIPKPD